MKDGESFYDLVYGVVRQIPLGRVATYGQIAAILGHPRAARAVGYALHALRGDSDHGVPWQRVINAMGRISFKGDILRAERQRHLLELEGIVFQEDDTIPLATYRWDAPTVTLRFQTTDALVRQIK